MEESGDSNRNANVPTVQSENQSEPKTGSDGDKASDHDKDFIPLVEEKNEEISDTSADIENQDGTKTQNESGDGTADAVSPEMEAGPSASEESDAVSPEMEAGPSAREESDAVSPEMEAGPSAREVRDAVSPEMEAGPSAREVRDAVSPEMEAGPSAREESDAVSPEMEAGPSAREESDAASPEMEAGPSAREESGVNEVNTDIKEKDGSLSETSIMTTEDNEEEIQEDKELRDKKEEKYRWIFFVLPVLCALVGVAYQFSYSTPPTQLPKKFDVVNVFSEGMEKVKSTFPNQHPELWRRSRIHISRHLKTVNPTEPVSLILTSGRGAERTLGCLAQRLAGAFSTALNSSILNIDGKNKASQDSDQVKLDIDSNLKKAFGGKKLAAVIHRIEELPPGSTLIFYRYCDHENAAFKKVFLVFTVMLDVEEEVLSNATLARVEDMVHEQIKHKFVSSDKSAVFNQMDVDKLSGLWSRISHLILPVAAEEKIEQQGCEHKN